MKLEKRIGKMQHSEWVIRNALYWVTTHSRWKIDEGEFDWIITFDTFTDECQFEFARLLNDYQLREILYKQTGHVRASIIDRVLINIDARLAE
ncbi:His-Xaa-Ser system protein HxsD [Serratia fonticola]|uniref:His-Xaa-Ser system protein HxsD n=2 Tax=Serratia fonticola TaxID=47917 RepID=A0AAJ1Y753_SERFO|nr:His-Xaa-Ser system protein HxsD [Serratia fonticola]MDQ9125226.1 His-Xaa-Ser system protein HxsD [Serratia fonticola]